LGYNNFYSQTGDNSNYYYLDKHYDSVLVYEINTNLVVNIKKLSNKNYKVTICTPQLYLYNHFQLRQLNGYCTYQVPERVLEIQNIIILKNPLYLNNRKHHEFFHKKICDLIDICIPNIQLVNELRYKHFIKTSEWNNGEPICNITNNYLKYKTI
jgi:hypothetical protein